MIRFACVCGRQLQAAEHQAGTRAACPVCARVVTVPDEAEGVRLAEFRYQPPPVTRPPLSADPVKFPTGRSTERGEVNSKARLSLSLAPLVLVLTLAMDSLEMWNAPAFASILLVTLASGAVREIRQSRGRLAGMWMALVGLGVGLTCLAANILYVAVTKA